MDLGILKLNLEIHLKNTVMSKYRKYVIFMKQDKGRGVAIMDKSKYTEKGLTLLSTKSFRNDTWTPQNQQRKKCNAR